MEIESSIPIPPKAAKRIRSYNFGQLEVGQSIFVGGGHSANFHTAARRKGIKVTVRMAVKNGVSGLRIWRIE